MPAPVKTISLPKQHHMQSLTVRSDDAATQSDTNTMEVVWTTGATVKRFGLIPGTDNFGYYNEALDISPDAVDISFLQTGRAPALDSHGSWSVDDIIGVIVADSVRKEEDGWVATLEFRDNDKAQAVKRSLLDGTLNNVSVGYKIFKYERDDSDGVPTFTARKWQPVEISIVAIGADSDAHTRDDDTVSELQTHRERLPFSRFCLGRKA
ncbi:MAG: HK97 family phage prohead protease, partial [Pseudomonadota bacterium]